MTPGPRRERWRSAPRLSPKAAGLAVQLVFTPLLGCVETPPLELALSGCEERWTDGRCAVDEDTELSVFLAGTNAARIELDGAALTATTSRLQGGLRARVRVDRPGQLELRAEQGGRSRASRIALVTYAEHPAVAEADRLRRRGALVEAATALAAIDADETDAIRMRARLAGQSGRAEQAVALFRRGLPRVHAEGRLVAETRDRSALAFALADRLLRYPEAVVELDRLEALASTHPPAAGWASYFRSNLLRELGDLRGALSQNARALELAERLGIDALAEVAADRRVELLVRVGRTAEAARLGREVLARAAAAPACTRATALHNAGWLGLIDDGQSGATTLAHLTAAVQLFESECPRRHDLDTARLNLADAQLDAGRSDEAERTLAAVATATMAPRLALRAALISGRLSDARGAHASAAEQYAAVERRARQAGRPEAEHEAATRLAQALATLGDDERAEEAYARAEQVLDGHHALVPFGRDRGGFLGRHAGSTRAYVRLLLAKGRTADALQVVLRSRARALSLDRWAERVAADGATAPAWLSAMAGYRAVRARIDDDAASDWTRSKTELAEAESRRARMLAEAGARLDAALSLAPARSTPPREAPRPGECALVYFELSRDDWIGFAVDAAGVRWRHLGSIPPDSVGRGRALLEPFSDALRPAREVRVYTDGALDGVDFHALPFAGAPLITRASVRYPVGLAASATVAPVRTALVVSDTRGDLRGARAEADAVVDALGRLGFEVTRLEGQTATHRQVLAALQQSDLFHFAGHGEYSPRDVMASGLPLAAGGWLTAGDVLTLSRGPRLVVLSGCDTTRTATGATHAGIGLAHAFVAAGAEQVIAARVPVTDALALDLVRQVFTASTPGALSSLSDRLRAAQGSLLARGSNTAWESFRVLSR
jgi:tetratricopeptide (TPR) repeat protein